MHTAVASVARQFFNTQYRILNQGTYIVLDSLDLFTRIILNLHTYSIYCSCTYLWTVQSAVGMDFVADLGIEGVVESDAFEAAALDDAFASPRTV